MSQRPKISLVIPVFNTEKYLDDCLSSAVNQTLHDIEIICIDDKSNDNSLEILKKYSPLLSRQNTEKPYESYLKCREEARNTATLIAENKTIREIVRAVSNSQLLSIPNVIDRASNLVYNDVKESDDEELVAWVNVMDLPIEMVKIYNNYVNQNTRFDTHQGVKGLEFDRVMVIIDDSESKGNMFSYDKLFGIKDLSDIDKKNISDGKETSVERTQRLFYVTCTRAKDSLAIVMYTNNPEGVKTDAIRKEWFTEEEIVVM